MGRDVSSVAVLAALAATCGYMLGRKHLQWPAAAALAIVLAITSAFLLNKGGFETLSGTAAIVACLTILEAAYLIGVRMNNR